MRSFVEISSKNDLLRESYLATEYMVRRLRNALPYSLRVVNSGQCLEFMSITASGSYLNPVPTLVNGASANGNTVPITTAPFVGNGGGTDHIIIGANASSELYGIAPSSLAEIESITAMSVTLSADRQWLRNSISQRFYIVENPSAFCLVSNELRLYNHLSSEDATIDTAGDYALLAQSVAELASAFSISSVVEDQNTRVTLSLLFTKEGARLEALKQVVIRNVP